jgi:two-component system, cell cycle sensor histidine kinase and response regulator CckA
MASPLRILHLEDNLLDAELVAAAFETYGLECEITRVETEQAFTSTLESGGIDLILADYSLPSFDGVSALKFAHKKCPDVPYIFISGTMGEDIAVESLKLGATDYILKNNLSRLVPSVRRALNEVQNRNELKRAEAEALHMQKLESLRVLAGGIAHDLNNLMVAVMGNAGLALRALPPGSPAREFVADIEKATEKVTNFSRQILSFTSKVAPNIEPVQLNEIVNDTAHFLLASISKNAELEFSLSDGLPVILAEPQNMQQIVMNLIINASDAIGDNKGIIKVSTGKMHADRKYLDSLYRNGIPEGEYVFFEVSDTGCGMSAETRKRIFEPFFTTKFTGRGIGLSAVFGIVSAHGGTIALESEEGCGATFRILLPVPVMPVKTAASKPDAEDVWHGKGSILLVDDEKDSLLLAKKVLETAGYSVLTAGDGAEAIKTYRKNSDTISAVIMDLVMPHVRGDEAAKEMRAIKDDVNVLLLSGFHEIDLTDLKKGPGKTATLEKPYKITKLLGAVQDILKA